MSNPRETLVWAVERLQRKAEIDRHNAGLHGVKLLRGHGYPDSVMHDAQDALAIETVLAALSTPAGEGPLSSRVRPNVEAAPWVVEEIKKLEAKLPAAVEGPQDINQQAEDIVGALERCAANHEHRVRLVQTILAAAPSTPQGEAKA